MQYDKAIVQYEAMRTQSPNDKEILTALAQVYRQSGQDAKALPLYDALLRADPTLRWIDDAKAAVLTHIKRYEEARAIYVRQIERTPENRQNYANLAYVWDQEGKPDAFLAWVKPRLEKTPASPTLMAVTLDEFIKQKREDAGWALLRSLAEKYKMQRPVLESYASLLQQRQKKAESLAVYRQIAGQNPTDTPAQTMLADQLDFNNLTQEANKVYVALLDRVDLPNAERQSLRRQLGGRYARQNKWPEAIAQFQALVANDTKDFDAVMTLGTFLVRAGLSMDAIALYNRVLAEKDFPMIVYRDAHNRLGSLYEKQNNKSGAIHHFQEALRLEPANSDATDGLHRLGLQ